MDFSPEQQNVETMEKEEKRPEMSPQVSQEFIAFQEKMGALATPEEKIAFGLEFMRSSISQEGSPRFREFWDSSKIVVGFFKENVDPAIRSRLWEEHRALVKEARRLQDTLRDLEAGLVDQIDQAITYLEGDIQNMEGLLQQGAPIELPPTPSLHGRGDVYNHIQKELNLLNALAMRLNGFRKELMKMQMRMRFKTKFFKRLSQIGDHIFPKKKLLVEEISGEFERDIEEFVSRHFQGDKVIGAPYFALREEIKALQGLAKILTLSSPVFNRTRLKLSECWDKIKVLEKEHKKEVFAKKQVASENRGLVEKKIEELATTAAGLDLAALDKALEGISAEMRQIDLTRADVIFLKEQMGALRAPHLAASLEKMKAQEALEEERARQRKEKVVELQSRIESLAQQGQEARFLEQSYAEFKEEMKQLGLSRIEQQALDRALRQLKDRIQEMKEQSILNLSEDDRSALQSLKEILAEKKLRRSEIKEQIEAHKQEVVEARLDIRKAMQLKKLIDEEVDLLDQANTRIQEIEEKITEIES
jgi:hypothetical protein